MGWSAANNSQWSSFYFLSSAVSQAYFIPRLINKLGNTGLLKSWNFVAGCAYFLVGQSGRPVGASRLRRSLQYAGPALVLQDPWTDPVSYSIRSCVIAQGIEKTTAGRGELTAAYDAVTDMVGCIMPMVWGSLFQLFSSAVGQGNGGLLSVLGLGGHFALAALLRALAGAVVWAIPEHQLASANRHEG